MLLKRKKTDNLLSLFAGFCFFLSTVELMIPKPLPFFRMGLANLPILIGTSVFSFPTFFLLLLIKILGQALISGTIFSYITVFSAAGTICSGLVMYAMKGISKKAVSFIGISAAGAFVSNTVQIFLAIFMIFGRSALYMFTPMLVLGMISSILLGVFANKFTSESIWFSQIIDGSFELTTKFKNENKRIDKKKNALRLGSGILLFLLLFFINLLTVRALILGVALILCLADRQKVNFLNLVIMFFAIILFNLYPPSGKIILEAGSLAITNEALLRGIEKAVILQSMIYISKWIIKVQFNLKGKIGDSLAAARQIFFKLLMMKSEVNIKNLIPSLDALLLSINKL